LQGIKQHTKNKRRQQLNNPARNLNPSVNNREICSAEEAVEEEAVAVEEDLQEEEEDSVGEATRCWW
jgi:hypothetical protein